MTTSAIFFFPFKSQADRAYIQNAVTAALEANTLFSLNPQLNCDFIQSLCIVNFLLNFSGKIYFVSYKTSTLVKKRNSMRHYFPTFFCQVPLCSSQVHQRNRLAISYKSRLLFYTSEAFTNDVKPTTESPSLVIFDNLILSKNTKLPVLTNKLALQNCRILSFTDVDILNASKIKEMFEVYCVERVFFRSLKDNDVIDYVLPKKVVIKPFLREKEAWANEAEKILDDLINCIKKRLSSNKIVPNGVSLLEMRKILITKEKKGSSAIELQAIFEAITLIEQLTAVKSDLINLKQEDLKARIIAMKWELVKNASKKIYVPSNEEYITRLLECLDFKPIVEFAEKLNFVEKDGASWEIERYLKDAIKKGSVVILERNEEDRQKLVTLIENLGLQVSTVNTYKSLNEAVTTVELFKRNLVKLVVADDIDVFPATSLTNLLVTFQGSGLEEVLRYFENSFEYTGEITFLAEYGSHLRNLTRELDNLTSSVFDSKIEQLSRMLVKKVPLFSVEIKGSETIKCEVEIERIEKVCKNVDNEEGKEMKEFFVEQKAQGVLTREWLDKNVDLFESTEMLLSRKRDEC